MSQVAIVRCPDYTKTKEAIVEALHLLGGLEDIIPSGAKVCIKPNVLCARTPDDAATTHPTVVAAMCELVREAGGVPMVGDCSGIVYHGITKKALEVSGIEAAARDAGAEVVNFETAGFDEVDVPNPLQFKKLHISRPVLAADVVISLGKAKTHELTHYTGCVKNLFGVIPLNTRKEAHFLGQRELFGEAVADIYSVVKPSFAVLDAVVGMEGNGPGNGTPKQVGVILASRDCVALDVVGAEMVGFDPMTIPTTVAALKKGFGDRSPEVVGTPLADVKTTFKPAAGGVTKTPPFLIRLLGKRFWIRPKINQKKCVRCGACHLNCSPHAIEKREDGSYWVNKDKCILCYCCRELCPKDAVDIQESPLARLVSRRGN